MDESWPIKRVLKRELPSGDYIEVTAGLCKLDGNKRPYFSVTADLWERRSNAQGITRRNAGRDIDAGGCMHDEVLKWFPTLAPVIAVHLADDDGVPMHAVANGWYFYSGKAREWEEARPGETWHNREGLTDRERAARMLNVSETDIPHDMDRDAFEVFAESLRPLWASQARTAIETLESIPVS